MFKKDELIEYNLKKAKEAYEKGDMETYIIIIEHVYNLLRAKQEDFKWKVYYIHCVPK